MYKEKLRCPHCNGIDTRRYTARKYGYCFTCDRQIPLFVPKIAKKT